MPSLQPFKKSSQSLPPMAAKKVKIVFCRGAYLAENTSQAPSVRLLRPGAKGVRAGGCKKTVKEPRRGFLTV